MAEFSRLVITDNGSRLIMKLIKKETTIRFTRVAASAQIYQMDALKALAALQDVRQINDISEVETEDAETIKIYAILPNTELEQGYYIKAVGVYAEDPDEGEILYGVSVEMSEDGCYVPPFRGRTASSLYFNLSVAVGNSENVTLKVDQGAVATVKQLNKVRYPEFEMAGERENLVSGERQDTLFGKIVRWFADLKAIAFSGSYRDLSDKPALGSAASQVVVNNDTTSLEGYVADARVVKVHGDEIDSLNTALAGHKTSGDHDERYYTEVEVNNLLAGKSGTGHAHDERYYTEAEVNNLLAGKSATGHVHDDRYYTEAEVNSLIDTRIPTTASCNKNWHWNGQAGQPTWLWGGNDGTNMYVYSPANFRVSYATSAGTATSAGSCTGNAASASCVYTYIVSNKNSAGDRYRIALTSEGNFRPDGLVGTSGNLVVGDSKFNLGISSNRWKQLYAATATISTSDRNQKKDIKPLSEQHLKFFMRLQPVSFLFRDGESGRTHTGFIAQDIEEAMAECGLTDLDFAGFCKDVKQKESRTKKIREVKDGDGKTREEEYEETVYEDVMDENGNPACIYSLRYEEFIALNTHMIQTVVNRMEEIDQRMADLENRMENLEKLIKI